jgi:hypothetical protein|tara:strand:- start:4 stop:144 length:141 start_codon:yes stop_codon:yes gene_type:complete
VQQISFPLQLKAITRVCDVVGMLLCSGLIVYAPEQQFLRDTPPHPL